MKNAPSRDANPFATCWTSGGALPYLSVGSHNPETVAARLAACHWRGQLVGRHGAGKSTLLAALREPLAELGRRPRLAGDARLARRDVVLAEGFERLGWLARRRLLAEWGRAGCGFVITSHQPLRRGLWRLPVLAELKPDPQLLGALFERLVGGSATPVTLFDALGSFERRGGNLREVWFDLYDLHERRLRGGRTKPVGVAYA